MPPTNKRRILPKDDDDERGGDDWMMTYGDLMTQLVCFFVLLMSFSVMSSVKYREAVVSLNEALSGTGVLPAWRDVVGDLPRSMISSSPDDPLSQLKAAIDQSVAESNMSSNVDTEMRKEGLVITLREKEPSVFFDSADARVKEEAQPILDQIGRILKDLPNDIRVEGHTDSRPIHTLRFPSNWELSTMRATNVLRHLRQRSGILPERLSAAGYGPYRPIASNDTEAGMSKNRRVEIVVLRMVTPSGGKVEGEGAGEFGQILEAEPEHTMIDDL